MDPNSSILVDKPEGTTISLSVAQNTAVQGDNVTLTCQVSAAIPPVSEYRFYVNDSNTPLKTLKSTNRFTIYVVQRVHYGRYKCEAWNVVGEGQSNVVILNINGKSLSREIQAQLISLSHLHINMDNAVVWTDHTEPIIFMNSSMVTVRKKVQHDCIVYHCKPCVHCTF